MIAFHPRHNTLLRTLSIALGACAVALVIGCADDETYVSFRDPSLRYAESAVSESSTIKQLRKDFFAATGSYLIFNDTLQHYSLGKDRYGEQQWFTEKVDLTYSVGTESSATTKYVFTLLETDEEKEAAVEFLKAYILPHLTGSLRPFAWLLTSTITHSDNFGTFNDYAATGQEVAAVAVKLVPTLSESNRQRYASQVMNILLGKLILNNSAAFSQFFAVCEDLYATQFADPEITTAENNEYLYKAGFITRGKDPSLQAVSNGFYPDREADLTSYCRSVVANTQEALEKKYGAYPLVMLKIQLARTTMERIGYKF